MFDEMHPDTRPGDTVSIPLLPFGRHEGIVGFDGFILSRSRKYGGVVSIGPAQFSEGLLRENHGYIGRLTRQETVERAQSLLGDRGYDVVNNNCMHFVNEVNGLPRDARLHGSLVPKPSLSDMLMRFSRPRY